MKFGALRGPDGTWLGVDARPARAQLAESLSALQVTLTSADLARMEQAIHASAVAGTRYDEHQMRVLDSER